MSHDGAEMELNRCGPRLHIPGQAPLLSQPQTPFTFYLESRFLLRGRPYIVNFQVWPIT